MAGGETLGLHAYQDGTTRTMLSTHSIHHVCALGEKLVPHMCNEYGPLSSFF